MPEDPRLKVVIEGDASGMVGASKDAKQAIDSVGDATASSVPKTAAATEATSKLTVGHRELREIIMLIAREGGPEMGAAVSAAALAGTGGMFAAVIAARELFAWLEKIQKKAEAVRQAASEMWIDVQKGAADAWTAVDGFAESIDKAQNALASEAFKRGWADQKKNLDDVIEQHKKILQAIEDEQLAKARGDKTKEAAIRAWFAGATAADEKEKDQRTIELLQGQLDAEGKKAAATQAQIDALTPEQAKLLREKPRIEGAPGAVGDIKALRSAAEKQLDGMTRLFSRGEARLNHETGRWELIPGGVERSVGLRPGDPLGVPSVIGTQHEIDKANKAVAAVAAYDAAVNQLNAFNAELKKVTDNLATANTAHSEATSQVAALTDQVTQAKTAATRNEQTRQFQSGMGAVTAAGGLGEFMVRAAAAQVDYLQVLATPADLKALPVDYLTARARAADLQALTALGNLERGMGATTPQIADLLTQLVAHQNDLWRIVAAQQALMNNAAQNTVTQ